MVHILFSFLLLSPPPFLPQMRLKFVAFGGGARPKGKGGGGPNPLQSLQALLPVPEYRLPLLIHIVFPVDDETVACTDDSNALAFSTIPSVCLVRRSCHFRLLQCGSRAEWWINDARSQTTCGPASKLPCLFGSALRSMYPRWMWLRP